MKKIENNYASYNRKCIATGIIKSSNQMLRFDYNKKENIILLDLNRELKGRGAYFIPTIANWEFIIKHKCLNKTFRTAVAKETYELFDKQLKEGKWLKEIE
ncbi:YlxR family protein [Mycoplasmopsis primatum]|uniref:YlxR family protein n=1 Tax=Mycoplasmopsis primatum TaxID=55604 RepID=UPI0004976ED6|nr:YlxR family protein [Mycoplasmopsis primatum]